MRMEEWEEHEKKEEQEVQEQREKQEEQDERDEREETTKGKGDPADEGKKLQRGRLIFGKDGTKALLKGWLYGLMW